MNIILSCFYIKQDSILSILGLGLVVALVYYYLKRSKKINTSQKLLITVFPLIHYVLFLIKNENTFLIFKNPMFISIILILTVIFLKNRLLDTLSISSVLVVILYYSIGVVKPNYFLDNVKTDKAVNINSPKLSNFTFKRLENKTFKIYPNNKKVIIMTWNEKCLPCKLAMREMPKLIDKNSYQLYYLYVNPKNKFKPSLIAKYSNHKEKIILDDENIFYQKFKMNSFPNILVFENDRLVKFYEGYNRKAIKNYLSS